MRSQLLSALPPSGASAPDDRYRNEPHWLSVRCPAGTNLGSRALRDMEVCLRSTRMSRCNSSEQARPGDNFSLWSSLVAVVHVRPSCSLHRSQISENFDFKEYVIDAGSGSRIRRLRQPILLLFWGQNFQHVYRFFHFKNRLLNGREAAV